MPAAPAVAPASPPVPAAPAVAPASPPLPAAPAVAPASPPVPAAPPSPDSPPVPAAPAVLSSPQLSASNASQVRHLSVGSKSAYAAPHARFIVKWDPSPSPKSNSLGRMRLPTTVPQINSPLRICPRIVRSTSISEPETGLATPVTITLPSSISYLPSSSMGTASDTMGESPMRSGRSSMTVLSATVNGINVSCAVFGSTSLLTTNCPSNSSGVPGAMFVSTDTKYVPVGLTKSPQPLWGTNMSGLAGTISTRSK